MVARTATCAGGRLRSISSSWNVVPTQSALVISRHSKTGKQPHAIVRADGVPLALAGL